MTPRLLLYIEEDYILPLAIDADGKVHEYAKDDENRLWLYFNSAEHSVDYARKYRGKVASSEYGYYGNIFENIASGKTAIINGRDLPYFDLLKLSAVLTGIRQFYQETTGDSSVNIKTSFVFAESVGFDGRKAFLEGMSRNGFEPVAFSKSLSSVLVDYAARNMPEVRFGDHILLVTSAGDTLRLTSAVFDGDKWLSDGSCEVVSGVGDAPLKTAFVSYVVDEIDKNRGYLNTSQKREKEYEYQYQNADRWLERADASGNIYIDDFAYSFDTDIRYSSEIKKNFLDSVLADAVKKTVDRIIGYKSRVMDKHMVYAILCGPAFDDLDFVNMMRNSLDNPSYLCIPSHLMPKAMSVYFDRYYELEEDFGRFDDLARSMQKSRSAISAWVESAGRIRSLWEDLSAALPELEAALNEDMGRLDDMIGLCDERLEHSDFQGAYDKLLTYSLPTTRASSAYHGVHECLKRFNDLQPVFDKVRSVDGARLVVDRISEICHSLTEQNGLVTLYKAFPCVLDQKREEVRFYESHYDEYLSLLRKFKTSTSLQEKRELVTEMSKITKQELPSLKLRTVVADLKADLKVTKEGFLGMKKRKSVVINMSIKDGDTLPCDAVMNISSEQQITANEGDFRCIAVEIPKGESSFCTEIPLPDSRLDSKKMIYVNLFVAPKVLDKRAIRVETESGNNFVYVKQD